MTTVNVYAAKTQLSQLLNQVEKGNDVIITRSGRPIAKLTSITRSQAPRKLGGLKGRIKIAKDFDEPLPAELLAAFEGD